MSNVLFFSALCIGMVLFGPILAIASAGPPMGRDMLVLVAPGRDPHAVVTAAGGRSLFPVSAPFAQLARLDDPIPVAVAKLRAAGALWVVDGRRLSQICGQSA